MASKGKKTAREEAISGLTDISRARPHPDDLWISIQNAGDTLYLEDARHPIGALTAFHIEQAKLSKIPDSTFALMISTAVEQALELAISTHFVDVSDDEVRRMFDYTSNGPLSTFSAKIKAAYAMGVIPRSARDELDMIRHIRNAFAHSWEQIGFSTKAVAIACDQLRIPKLPTIPPEIKRTIPKGLFFISAMWLYRYLEWNGQGPMLYRTHKGARLFSGL